MAHSEPQDCIGKGLTLQCCWHLTSAARASSAESPARVRNEFLAPVWAKGTTKTSGPLLLASVLGSRQKRHRWENVVLLFPNSLKDPTLKTQMCTNYILCFSMPGTPAKSLDLVYLRSLPAFGEMAPLVKGLLHKHEDLCANPQKPTWPSAGNMAALPYSQHSGRRNRDCLGQLGEANWVSELWGE